MKNVSLGIAALFAVLVCTSRPAEAALILAIDTNGAQACASDNNTGCSFGTPILDQNGLVNQMSFGGTPVMVGGLSVFGSSQTATYGPPNNILNTASFQITNTTGTTQIGNFAVSATDFTSPISFTSVSGSGTLELAQGSQITMRWYADPANAQGAEFSTDTPGILLHECSITALDNSEALACAPPDVATPFGAPYSMTLYTLFSLTAGGTLVGRSQTEIAEVEAVPEPMTMTLLGLGLLGAGIMRRRR